MNDKEHVALWNRCLQFIKDNGINETAFNTWFNNIRPLKYENKTLTLGVPSPFFIEYLEENYLGVLSEALHKEIGSNAKLMYHVLTDSTNNQYVDYPGNNRSSVVTVKPIRNVNKSPDPLKSPGVQDLDSHLNPNYNFENFIKGVSNELSRTAGETIAQHPAKTFNPLFLFGPSGVGKTHLANAIGTRIKELYPEKRVLYVSAHLFMVQYTDAVRTNNSNNFINFYQIIDVLILDDVQEFTGKTQTQNTFFHIFNHLHQNGKQLIMTCDRPPMMLQGMEDRLLTRFKGGLVAEMYKPDLELRRNILSNKICRDGLTIPNEVINYIAENVEESVRELEGIINSLLAQSIIFKRDIDLSLAERIVHKAVKMVNKDITIEEIVQKVCSHFGMEESAIHTKSRKRELVQARQIAMYLAKKHTDNSTAKIGLIIGKKDHATVLHACKMIENQAEVDKVFKTELDEIESSLKK